MLENSPAGPWAAPEICRRPGHAPSGSVKIVKQVKQKCIDEKTGPRGHKIALGALASSRQAAAGRCLCAGLIEYAAPKPLTCGGLRPGWSRSVLFSECWPSFGNPGDTNTNSQRSLRPSPRSLWLSFRRRGSLRPCPERTGYLQSILHILHSAPARRCLVCRIA